LVHTSLSLARQYELDKRRLLPEYIILVRHGESTANVDSSVLETLGDNRIELTQRGSSQALDAGKRIKQLVGDQKVHMFVSPFQRAYQTARNLRHALEENIMWTTVDANIREQDMGNLQTNFCQQRKEQQQIGRFYYRFHNGESGADVFSRVSVFWRTIQELNTNPTCEPVPVVVVVTHGLTMRLLAMRVFGWSPDTFESVWNPDNCHLWVLKKNLGIPTDRPYDFDFTHGDAVKSSLEVQVTLRNGEKQWKILEDYLSLPAPRTWQKEIALQNLTQQYKLNPGEIVDVDFFANKQFTKFL